MSILNLLSGESSENTDSRTKLTNNSGALILGGAGFLVAKENNYFRNQTKSAFNTLTSNRLIPETAQVGQAIRTDIDVLKDAVQLSKSKAVENFKKEMLEDSNLNRILQSSDTEEAKAFLGALFDEISGREIEADFKDIIENIRSVARTTEDINEKNRNTLKTFFKQYITADNETFERFQSSYKRRLKVTSLFEKRESIFSPIDKQIKMSDFSTFDEYRNSGKTGSNFDNNILNKINKRFNQIKGLAGPEANVSLVGYDEYGNGTRSMYARVSFSGARTLNIPLHLEKNNQGLIYYRATENLSTRYQAPLRIIDANELLKGASLTSTSIEDLKAASMTFDDYIFKNITTNLGNINKFNNLSTRNINDINAYIRSFGVDVPRSMVYETTTPRLEKQLIQSRLAQSGIGFISGLEKMTREQQNLVHKRLLQFFPEDFAGPPGSQTILQRLENPFERGSELMFKNIQLLGHGIASIEQLDVYGRLDRSIQPQTAREQQMYGRYEVIEKLHNLTDTDKLSKFSDLKAIDDKLIGMKSGSLMVGANVATIMAFGDAQIEKLGLSEGVSLFGGNIDISKSITKTVVEEELYETKLMKHLIQKGDEGITLNTPQELDEFFRTYGDKEGRAVLGKLDKDFSVIKRQGGIKGLHLKVVGTSQETGRNRYHISGYMVNDFKSGKVFGTFLKDTLKNANESVFNEYLDRIKARDLSTKLGLKSQSTILTTDAFIKKSPQYIMTNMMGGLDLLSDIASSKVKTALSASIGEDDDFVKLINLKYNQKYTDLSQATVQQRSNTQIEEFLKAFVKEGSLYANLDSSNKGFAHTLSYMAHLAEKGKFDLSSSSFEQILRSSYHPNAKTSSGQSVDSFIQQVQTAKRSGIMLGAGSMYAGTHHSELGRNLAKTEPRLANYLYSSLRSHFNFTKDEATNYISALVSRQQGIEGRPTAVAGMQLMSESISNISNQRVANKMTKLGIDKYNKNEIQEILAFGQREKDLVDYLSRRSKGGILDLEDIDFKDKNAFKQLKQELGGKTEIYLPGRDVFENMIGHEIRTTQKVLDIEAEYKRNLADFLSAVGNFQTTEGQKNINDATKGIYAVKKSISDITSRAMRESLSGRVLGSGSYAGSGLTLGGVGEEIYDESEIKNTRISDKFKKLYNKEKGYLAFIDAQTFLDGMTSYREALKKSDPNLSNKQINNLMTNTLRDFFLSIHSDSEETAVRGLVQRNPTLGFGHYMPGMALYRYDYLDTSVDEKIFNMLKEKTGLKNLKLTKEEYKETVDAAVEAEKKAIKGETEKKVIEEYKTSGKELPNLKELKENKKALIKEKKQMLSFKNEFQEQLNLFYGAFTGKTKKYDKRKNKYIQGDPFKYYTDIQFKGMSYEELLTTKQNLIQNINETISFHGSGKKFKQKFSPMKEKLIKLTDEIEYRKEFFNHFLEKKESELLKHADIDEQLNLLKTFAYEKEIDSQYDSKPLLVQMNEIKEEIQLKEEEIKGISSKQEEYHSIYKSLQPNKATYKKRIKTAIKTAIEKQYKEGYKILESDNDLITKQFILETGGFEVEDKYFSKSLNILESAASSIEDIKIKDFDDLVFVEEQLGEKFTYKGKEYETKSLVNKVLNDTLKVHKQYGEYGGGLIRFPNVNLSANLIDEAGDKIGSYSGRMDYSRFAIGDYDADIYQIFFDTKRNLTGKMNQRKFDSGGLYEYGAKFLIAMEELGKGVVNLGKRLNIEGISLVESEISELEKERIIKDVGGLDVQIKTGMLGLVQASAESESFEKAMKLRGSGAALVSVAQEVLAIKAKKLPVAADLASEFTNILREGFRTGQGADRLKRFFMNNVLKGTAFDKGQSIRLSNIDISAIPEGKAKEAMKKRLEGLTIHMDEIFETFDTMFKTVHKHGMQAFGSNTRILQTLNKGGQSSVDMLNFLFSKYGSMEGGFLGKEFDFEEFDNQFNRVQEAKKQIFNNFKMPKAGGLVGAALGASYLFGATQSVSKLENQNKFSDMKARESLSNSNLYRMQEKRNQELPVESLGGPQNFYERPIHLNQQYAKMNRSQNIFANAPSESSGALLGKMVSDSGGKANYMIHDNRFRISNYEITQNLLG